MPLMEIPVPWMSVALPVGVKGTNGSLSKVAVVRAVTSADEQYIGLSREYNEHPDDAMYKLVLLSRCVTKLGDRTDITVADVQKLDARDIRALEFALYTLTYGSDALPGEEPGTPGG